MFLWTRLFVLLSIVLSSTYAAILSSISQANSTVYDFIIVGGGTAGSVLANRLSSNPSVKVLVVEAGGSNEGILNMQVPFLAGSLQLSPVDWNFTTVPQAGLNSRVITVPRGKVLGGSSSINIMTYNRGSDDMWNRLASVTGDSGWSWNSVKKYYLRSSRLAPPQDGHDTTGQVDPSAHGNGPVQVSLPGVSNQMDPMVEATAKQLGGRFAFNVDINAGREVGFGYLQSSIGGGERSSAATAYLQPVIGRPNLDVLLSTTVTKLITTSKRNGQPVFDTVEMAASASGQRFRAKAKKEVLLCAGAIGSPHILLLSGIGPKADLQQRNISVNLNAPDVGQHLAEHPLIPNHFIRNNVNTTDNVARDPAVAAALLAQWQSSRTGLYTTSGATSISFLKLPKFANSSTGDPSSGPGSGNTEMIFLNSFVPFGIPRPATGIYMTVLTAVVSPKSRGTLTLASNDPFAQPAIDFGLFSDQFDVDAMLQVMKDVQTFVTQAPWNGTVVAPFGELGNATTDALKVAYIRAHANTVHHPMSTARMAGPGTSGVVDSQLRVKGASSLRIIDASTFPFILEIHPQAAVYTLAERASDIVMKAYNL